MIHNEYLKSAMLKNLRRAAGLLAIGVMFYVPGSLAADSSPRERMLLDEGWKFHLGDDWGTGENLMNPAVKVAVYPVEVDGEDIKIAV